MCHLSQDFRLLLSCDRRLQCGGGRLPEHGKDKCNDEHFSCGKRYQYRRKCDRRVRVPRRSGGGCVSVTDRQIVLRGGHSDHLFPAAGTGEASVEEYLPVGRTDGETYPRDRRAERY